MQRIPLVEVMHFIFGPHNIPLQGSENSYKYISKCGLNTKIIDVSRIDWSKCGTVPSSYMYSTCTSSLRQIIQYKHNTKQINLIKVHKKEGLGERSHSCDTCTMLL